MNELLWFSMPGSIIVSALIVAGFWWKSDTAGGSILTAVAVPLVGFLVHQSFRCIFERFFGFDSPRRRVIAAIQSRWADDNLSAREAFLIWEASIYSDGFPEAFRSHDRGAWHYILSFWSCAFAAFLAIIVVAVQCQFQWAPAFVGAGVILGYKGCLTWSSLCEQEVHLLRRHYNLFQENRDALRNRNYVAPEVRRAEDTG